MAATTDNRVCYFYGQQGHIAANCPKKRQQRQQLNTSGRPPGQSQLGFSPRQQGYQRQPQQQNRLYTNPGGRNVVPNRPHFKQNPGIMPATPAASTPPTAPIYNGNPQQHHSQYLPPNHQHPAAGYYSAPPFPAYQQMPHQYSPAGYFSGHHVLSYQSPIPQFQPQYVVHQNPTYQPPMPPTPSAHHNMNAAYISSEPPGNQAFYSHDP